MPCVTGLRGPLSVSWEPKQCCGQSLQSVIRMILILYLTETWGVIVSNLLHFDVQEVEQIQGVLCFVMQRQ